MIIILFGCLFITVSAQDSGLKEFNSNSKTETVVSQNGSNAAFWDYNSERVITTSVIILEITILFFILFYWRRTKKESIRGSKNILKKNIKAIRQEKVLYSGDDKLSERRRNLFNKLNIRKLNSRNINNKAKQLSISKGELLLAAKLNQMQGRKI